MEDLTCLLEAVPTLTAPFTPKLARFMLYLKITNIFLKNDKRIF